MPRIGRWERVPATVALTMLCALLVIAPVPLGSNREWAWAPLGILVGVALMLYSVGAKRPVSLPQTFDVLAMLGCFILLLSWAIAQSIPIFSMQRAEMFSLVDDVEIPALPTMLAIDAERSWSGLLRMLTYVGVFALSVQLSQRAKMSKRIVQSIILSASAVTAYGFVMHVDNVSCVAATVLKAPLGSTCAFSGTFVNSGNYATFAGLAALACVASMYDRISTAARQLKGARARSLAIGLDRVLGMQAAALVILVGGLFLSGSKAGVASFLISCLITLLLLGWARRQSLRSIIFSAVLIAFFAFAMTILSGEMLLFRLIGWGHIGDPARASLYEAALGAISVFPLQGTGLGSFEIVFPLIQTTSLDTPYDKAHNVYLESILEFGAPASLLLFAMVALPALRCLRGIWARGRDMHLPALGFGATVLIAIHSLVDFGIQIPAIAVLYSALLGLGWAQSWSSRHCNEANRPD